MFKFFKLILFKKYFFLLLFININNNIFCGPLDKVVNFLYDNSDPTHLLSFMFGHQFLFLVSTDKQIKKISFFNKAVILFLEQIVEKYTGMRSLYSIFWDMFYSKLESKITLKFLFKRTKICKTYPADFSFNIVGYENITNSIDNMINVFKEGSGNDFIHPGHVLLYGPPGTGKTKMISDLLIKNKLDFVFVDMNLLQNDPVKNLPIIFENLSDKKQLF